MELNQTVVCEPQGPAGHNNPNGHTLSWENLILVKT